MSTWITPEMITDFTANTATVFSNLMPIVLILLGVLIGFMIIRGIVNMVTGKRGNTREDTPPEQDLDDAGDFDDDDLYL